MNPLSFIYLIIKITALSATLMFFVREIGDILPEPADNDAFLLVCLVFIVCFALVGEYGASELRSVQQKRRISGRQDRVNIAFYGVLGSSVLGNIIAIVSFITDGDVKRWLLWALIPSVLGSFIVWFVVTRNRTNSG